MAAFDSTGSSLSSTTWEGVLLELSGVVSDLNGAGLTPEGTAFALNYSAASGNVSLSYSFPATLAMVSGSMQVTPIAATDTTRDITPPTDGSIASADPIKAFVEAAQHINGIETSEGNIDNRVSLSFNADTGVMSGAVTIPGNVVTATDGISVVAEEFLLV